MKVKSESEVTQSSPTPSDPMDCNLPGSSVHGIFQARVLEWGAIAFSDRKCMTGKASRELGRSCVAFSDLALQIRQDLEYYDIYNVIIIKYYF